ncbi:hypothetical protein [Alienimonas chondri]|uniref:Uncharacterized protein n=1 Tax=Alienimonas chondri TaxID=2681879 RepID=A0ABX1VJ58_9PLAN|nr:hypothetical protein [Alienimonas chondri]NNJ27272.1 hypothetical protein [Alienimonas chondri]
MTTLAAVLLCLPCAPPAAGEAAADIPPDRNGAVLFLRFFEETTERSELLETATRQRRALRVSLGLKTPGGSVPVAPKRDFQPDHRVDWEAFKQANERFLQARTRPWTPADFPDVEEWVMVNRSALDLLREIDRRPEFAMPLLPEERAGEGRVTWWRPLRPLCEVAEAEAMRLIAVGRPTEAWDLLDAADRLARRLAVGPGGEPAMDRAMASQSISGMLTWGKRDWLRHAGADADMLARCRADLTTLPAAADVPAAIAARWSDAPEDIRKMVVRDAKDIGVRHELTALAFALAEYRARRGEYPDRLDALVPDFLLDIPADSFAEGAVRYRRKPGGFVAWSVGPNGIDDRGAVFRDISVHFPIRPDSDPDISGE